MRETEHAINAHILPALGDKQLGALTTAHIRNWLEGLAARPARLRTSRFAKVQKYRAAPKTADEKRARPATANRVLNVLKALLNRAFHDGQVADDKAWRKVKPFAKASEARIRFLTDAEAVRLVNASPADLRALVRAALLTGARFGELVEMRMHDVNLLSLAASFVAVNLVEEGEAEMSKDKMEKSLPPSTFQPVAPPAPTPTAPVQAPAAPAPTQPKQSS